mgnify:CR=1 FL=1
MLVSTIIVSVLSVCHGYWDLKVETYYSKKPSLLGKRPFKPARHQDRTWHIGETIVLYDVAQKSIKVVSGMTGNLSVVILRPDIDERQYVF